MKKITIFFIMFALIIWWCTEQTNITKNENKAVETKYILAIGDSLTAWYWLDPQSSYPSQLEELLKNNWYNYKIVNAGKSWDTSYQVLDRLNWNLEDTKYDLAILVVWGNDGLRWLDTSEMKQNIWKIIDKLKGKNIKVVLWGMKMPINYWNNYITSFEKVYVDVSKEKQVPLLEFFLSWVALDKNLNLQDWIHPNKQWYSIISNNIYNFLVKNNLIQK